MLSVLIAAILLMISGSTLLQTPLDPHTRPVWFLFFWLLCAWLTATAILLAIFDLLMVRIQARRIERQLREGMEKVPTANSKRE